MGQASPDNADLCLACGAGLVGGAEAGEARKRVTIVCADIRGSTELAGRVEPEVLRRVTDRYFTRMRLSLERHGGTVEKFIGDAVLAVFGLPLLHADDALRGVQAAVEMRGAVTALNEELGRDFGVTIAIGIGVNTGEVIAGDPASGQVFATGEAVNLAVRLEEAAKPGEILIGGQTYRLVRDAVSAERCKPLALRGRRERTEAFRLVDLQPAPAGVRLRRESPFVGREHEFSVLVEAFGQAVDTPGCRLVAVVGSAGVGKSRLARELLAARSGEATIVRGRCLPYGEGITFWPLKEAVAEAAGLSGRESAAEARAKLRSLVEHATDADLIVERVAETVDVAEAIPGRGGISWAIGRLFQELARRRPLIVVFDDIQWAEATFLDLVEYLAAELRDEPILLVCLARPELLELRSAWAAAEANVEVIALQPLPEAESARLAAGLLGDAEPTSNVLARVVAAAEGNPYFVEELVSMLIEEGRLRRRQGSALSGGDLSSVSLPPTIGALLAARIDALSPPERAALERGSVEGKTFHHGAVLYLTPVAERGALGERLNALVRKELIQPAPPSFADERAFEFRHQLLRDAAYQSLPKTRRAQLHERFATWLEEKAAQRAVEYAEILGYHLERAHQYRIELRPTSETALAERAANHLALAGLRAHARGDMPAAATLLTRAVNLLPADSTERQQLSPKLNDALFETGEPGPFTLSRDALRCFWRWPPGHRWAIQTRRGERILRCQDCGKTRRGGRFATWR